MIEVLKLLRMHQYIKNIFVFAPLFFSFSLFSYREFFIPTFVVFVLFSLIASSIYIFNDLMDIDDDKKHPLKKHRPLASGKVSKKTAKILILLLSTFSLFISYFLNFNVFLLFLIYFLLNIAYSLKLKHISIVDIFIIAVGFILRLFAGSLITDVKLSMWIIVITFLLAIFLALAKRRDDVILSLRGKNTRKNIDGYNLEFVNASMVLMAGVVIVSYILYTISSDITSKFHTNYLYMTSIFVVLGILRYMQITFVEENSGSPTKIVLKDKFLQLSILFWLISFIIIVKL